MTIPTSAALRLRLWTNASFKLGGWSGNLATSKAIQDLGYVEARLLQIEERLPAVFARQRRQTGEVQFVPEDLLLNEGMALSRLWLFGLYESIRTYRTAVRGNARALEPFDELSRTLNIVRAPLAKQQVAGRTTAHVPRTIIDFASGRIGWEVIDPRTESHLRVFRIALADQFLSAAGTLIRAGEAEAQERHRPPSP
jgi:hypothetical protein